MAQFTKRRSHRMLKLTSLVTAVSLVFLLFVAPATGQNRNLNADLPISTWQAPAFWDASSAHRDPLDREKFQAARPTPEAASGTPLSNSMAFVAIVPCRLVDTRSATGDSFGSPAMNASETRTIPVLSNTRCNIPSTAQAYRSEEHTSELQSPCNLVCRLLLEKKNKNTDRVMKRHTTSRRLGQTSSSADR